MKTVIKLAIIAVVLSISTMACTQTRYATDKFEVTAFTAIESSIVGNIIIRKGQTTEVTAEGSEELLNILDVRMDNDKLILTMEDRFLKRHKALSKRIISNCFTFKDNLIRDYFISHSFHNIRIHKRRIFQSSGIQFNILPFFMYLQSEPVKFWFNTIGYGR